MMYFTYGSSGNETTVYLRYAAIVPYPVDYEIPTTISRTEDKRLKVYRHSLAGPRKRTFIVTAYFKVQDASGESCWSDLEEFYNDIIHGAQNQFTFSDNFEDIFTVRMIQFGPPQFETNNIVKIRMVLEEDYET